MPKKLLGSLGALCAVGLLLAGCAAPQPVEPDKDVETSANIYLVQKPASFNTLKPAQAAEALTMSLIFDNLFTTNPDFEYIPRLAESWDVSEDATKFTFHLREGLKWSDGEPFTAEDVLFTFNLAANPTVGGAWSARLSGVEGFSAVQDGTASELSGLTAPDENTVEFTLSEPNAGFMSLIGYGPVFYILPKHVLGDTDPAALLEDPWFQLPTTGMGPYNMKKFNVDQDIELEANENYRTEVGIDHLFLKMLTSDVATAQLGTGEIDLVQVSALDLSTVTAIPGVSVSSKPSPGFTRISVNTTKFPDPKFRQAMLYAIDRQGIIDGILGGEATLVNSDIFTTWALPDDLETYEYNPEKAKKLLAEIGYDGSQELKISWIAGQRDRDQIVNVVIDNLNAVGIKVVANQVDGATLIASYTDMSYDMGVLGGGVYPMDPASSFPILSCTQHFPTGSNVSFFCNEELDAAMEAGQLISDQGERAEFYQEAARIDNKEVPYVWLNNPNIIWATSERLQGFEPHGDFTNGFWNAADWTIVGD